MALSEQHRKAISEGVKRWAKKPGAKRVIKARGRLGGLAKKGRPNKKFVELGISAKGKEWLGYRDHKYSAKARGIPFRLTYEEWISIWKQSKKFHLRGRNSGCYVMARNGDRGAYEVGNVEIISHEENSSQPHYGRTPVHQQTKQWREQHSKVIKQWASKPKVRKMLSAAGKKGAAARWRHGNGF